MRSRMKISIKVAIRLVALVMRLINPAERKESLLSIALSTLVPRLLQPTVELIQLVPSGGLGRDLRAVRPAAGPHRAPP